MNTGNMDRRSFLRTCAFTTGVMRLSMEEKAIIANKILTGLTRARPWQG